MKKRICQIIILLLFFGVLFWVSGIETAHPIDSGEAGDLGMQDALLADGSEEPVSVLPVVNITMTGRPGDDYKDAQILITEKIEEAEPEAEFEAESEAESEAEPEQFRQIFSGAMQIRLRGNSTRYRSKQPYKIKLEEKSDLFGMGENKHWVLLANDIDHTLIRNKITMDFASAIGMKFACESRLVSLYVNSQYMGVYQLSEQIRVDEERVDIYDWDDYFETEQDQSADGSGADGTEASVQAASPHDATPQTGGFILEADFYAFEDDSLSRVITNFQQPFYFNTPKVVPEDSELYQYAANYIQSFEYALHSDNFIYHSDDVHYAGSGRFFDRAHGRWSGELTEVSYTDPAFDGYHYSELFDLDSLVQNFLVCEMTMNWDCMKNSVFLYKDIEGLAQMGPSWDYDWAYGNINMYNIDTYITDDWQTTNNYFTNEQYYQSVQWNRYLIRDPFFVLQVYEKYREIRDVQIRDFVDSIDTYETLLASDGALNDARWESTYGGMNYSGATSENYTDAFSSLREFVTDRVDWLDAQFTDYDTLLQSLGYYEPSDLLEISTVTEQYDETGVLTGYEVSVSVRDSQITGVELQINGTKFLTGTVSSYQARIQIPADMLDEAANLFQVRALNAENEYLHVSEKPEAATVSNYFVYRKLI